MRMYTPVSRALPSTLKEARLHLGLTQQMLADFTRLSVPTIKRAERGETLRPDVVSLICQYISERYGREVLPEDIRLVTRFGVPASPSHAHSSTPSFQPRPLKIKRATLIDFMIWKRCLHG